MNPTHQTALTVGFKHCDPAGIVFYPRYIEMLNDVVEDWFQRGLGCDFATLHLARELAIPVVTLEIAFQKPGHLGDALHAGLTVQQVGNSSLVLDIALVGKRAATMDELKLRARLKLVFVRMSDKRSVPIPEDLRAAILTYQSAPEKAPVTDVRVAPAGANSKSALGGADPVPAQSTV